MIYTGDVQLVHAVGKPRRGTAYDIEPLPNCIIFPCKGQRPLPNCLGGGDLGESIIFVKICISIAFRRRWRYVQHHQSPENPGAPPAGL